jgi:hypothetical protein
MEPFLLSKIFAIIGFVTGLIFLYLLRLYIKSLDKDCTCDSLNKNLHKYLNIYTIVFGVYSVIIAVLNYNFLINTPNKLKYFIYLSFVIVLVTLITNILILKYIYTINKECDCKEVKPTIRTVLVVWIILGFVLSSFVVLIPLILRIYSKATKYPEATVFNVIKKPVSRVLKSKRVKL